MRFNIWFLYWTVLTRRAFLFLEYFLKDIDWDWTSEEQRHLNSSTIEQLTEIFTEVESSNVVIELIYLSSKDDDLFHFLLILSRNVSSTLEKGNISKSENFVLEKESNSPIEDFNVIVNDWNCLKGDLW